MNSKVVILLFFICVTTSRAGGESERKDNPPEENATSTALKVSQRFKARRVKCLKKSGSVHKKYLECLAKEEEE